MKWLIIDGNPMFFKQYHVKFTQNRTGKFGVIGFLESLHMNIRELYVDVENVIVCWDNGKSRWRKEILPEYKANRDKSKYPYDWDDFYNQLNLIHSILRYTPLIQAKMENTEADDLIAWFVKNLKGKKVIITGDKDLIQLVDENTHVILTSNGTIYTPETFKQLTGYDSVKKWKMAKMLAGDDGDNVKGIYGIGYVKAKSIVEKYETYEDMAKDYGDIVLRNAKLMDLDYAVGILEKEREKLMKSIVKGKPNLEIALKYAKHYGIDLSLIHDLFDENNWKVVR